VAETSSENSEGGSGDGTDLPATARDLHVRRPSGEPPVTALLCVAVALLGALAGRAVHGMSGGALTRPAEPAPGAGGGVAIATLPRTAVGTGGVGPVLAALVGAVASTVVVLRFGASADLPAWLWFVAVGLLLGVVDVREHRLPNRVLLWGSALGVLLLTGAALVTDREDDLGRGLLAGLACFALLLGMALISPSGLGLGDVKLVGLTGLYLGWLGWPSVVTGLFLGFLVQALLGLCLLAARRTGLKTDLPFGPALLAGALVAALVSGPWALTLW
jgi:leader peptidase (prepilin peptidase)/N-methyltransferase